MDFLKKLNEQRLLLLILPVLLLPMLFISCGTEGDSVAERAAEGRVILGVDTAAESLDPRVGTSNASYRMQQLLFDPLIDQGIDGRLSPALARGWEERALADGHRQWTFYLQENVTFHDGSRFDAEDVAATFRSMLEEDFVSRKKAAFVNIESIEAAGPYELHLILSGPVQGFIANLPAVGILPEELCEPGAFKPLGTGPFMYVASPGPDRLEFAAFPDYYRGAPGIQHLTVRAIPDETTRSLEMMHQSIDIVINDMSERDAAYLAGDEHFKLVTAPGLQYQYIGFNHQHRHLRDARVRRAIAAAIDRQAIITHLKGGLARPAVSPMLPVLWEGPVAWNPPHYNPQLARRLLDEAGYTDPDGDGPRPRFTISWRTSSQRSSRDLATVIKDQLQEIGIDLEVQSTEWQTFYMDVVNGNFALYSMRWIGIIDPSFYGSLFHSASVPGGKIVANRANLNRGRYANQQMDALIEAAEAQPDTVRRWQIYADMQNIIDEDLPYIHLWYADNFAIMRSDLDGIRLTLNASFRELYTLHYTY